MPARPWPMPGLSRSANDGSSVGVSGRAALARVGFAGSFFECFAGSRRCGARGRSEPFTMVTIWVEYGGEESDATCGSWPSLTRPSRFIWHRMSSSIGMPGTSPGMTERLLQLDPRTPDDLAPLLPIRGNQRGKFVGRSAGRLIADIGLELAHRLRLNRAIERGIEPID